MLFLRSKIPTVAVAAIALTASTFGLSTLVSAEQPVGDSSDALLAETYPPTLPIIEVTIPAGVRRDDENIADVIDSLIRGDSDGSSKDETPAPKPKPPPQQQQVSRKETMFRQQFTVRNNREFADEEVELFEDLLEQYTLYFSPLSPIENKSKITTDCTVHRQDLLRDGDRKLDSISSPEMLRHGTKRRELDNESLTTLQVDFTMTYESQHYNVTEYPKLFQNWMANNLHVVLEQMQFLNMDVASVDMPRRIVVMTPTEQPTPPPTSLPITKEAKNDQDILLPDQNVAMPPVPTPEVPNKWSITAVILFSVALVIAIAILTVGISIFLGHRQSSNENNEPTNADLEAGKTNPETASWKSTAAFEAQYEDNTLSTTDLELVETSSSVFQ